MRGEVAANVCDGRRRLVAGGTRSIGVATGNYDVETLLESGADVAFACLDDVDAVLIGLNL